MAKEVMLNPFGTLGGIDYTGQIGAATLDISAENKDTTNADSAGWKEMISGLLGGSVQFTFIKDSDLSGLDAAMWTAMTTRALVPFELRREDAAVSPSNPSWSGDVIVTAWKPIAGSVGDTNNDQVTFQITGAVTRATS